jgi:hypothetical protein
MDWFDARERLHAPMFAPLRGAIGKLRVDRWPTHAELTNAAKGVMTARGTPVTFVTPRDSSEGESRYYEVRIAETGEVETRAENWHDLFNALTWITYPRAKATINAQHSAILAERGEREARHRGPERDALTLFDEGGVAVLSTDPALFRRIVEFEWKALFWHERGALANHVRFAAFGHALFENGLEPHIGMVAKTVFLPASRLPDDASLAAGIDAELARHFSERENFCSPRAMAPMPVLGIPGWHPQTSDERFYDDPVHFRSRQATHAKRR